MTGYSPVPPYPTIFQGELYLFPKLLRERWNSLVPETQARYIVALATGATKPSEDVYRNAVELMVQLTAEQRKPFEKALENVQPDLKSARAKNRTQIEARLATLQEVSRTGVRPEDF